MSDELAQVSFDYGVLDEAKRVRNQVRAASIKARMKRTAEDIIAIGQDLLDAKEDFGHGFFLPWLKAEFEMSEPQAQRFMQVARRFGEETKSIKMMDFSPTILYALASPSTPDSVVSQVQSGEIPPTLDAIKEARDAQRKAEQAKEESEQKAEATRQQLTLFSKLSQDRIAELTGQIANLQEQIKVIETPESVEVIPKATLDQIANLQAQITELSQQKKLISDEAIKLQTDLKELRENTEAQRAQERYAAEVKATWKKANEAIYKALAQFTGHLPSSLDLHLFEGDEWARYDRTEKALIDALSMHQQLKSARYGQVVSDVYETSLVEVSP